MIEVGDPAPWQKHGQHRLIFNSVPGRYLILSFFHNFEESKNILRSIENSNFDLDEFQFFGITEDSFQEKFSYIYFLFDQEFRKAYGVNSEIHIVLNPNLHVIKLIPFGEFEILKTFLEKLSPLNEYMNLQIQAPIIILPDVFEKDFCKELIQLFEEIGSKESGIMRQAGEKSFEAYDHNFKSRTDYKIEDPFYLERIQNKFEKRIIPEIQKAFQYKVTKMERAIIGCYSAETGGIFSPHRDDTNIATTYRKFAASINLNDDFYGGELIFPEYSSNGLKPPIGCAVIFSCSLLHAVSKVTYGRRFAFLPFLYNDEGEELRQKEMKFLVNE